MALIAYKPLSYRKIADTEQVTIQVEKLLDIMSDKEYSTKEMLKLHKNFIPFCFISNIVIMFTKQDMKRKEYKFIL